jgi:DNA-binding MarR family transcriptional regulator
MAKAMARETSDLESHLGYWLRFVSNHVSHAFGLKVEAHGVTVAEWVILRALFDWDGVNPSQLADKIGMTRGAISKLVDRLVGKGLVLCRASKTDRRYQTLTLCASGRKLVPVLATLADRNDEEFFGHLSDAERAQLFATLRNIVQTRGLKQVPVD